MSAYYSTQATVRAKVDALDIQYWLDPDGNGSINLTALNSALAESQADILSYVQPRYGSTVVSAWDSSTRPEFIGQISDWLTLFKTLPGHSAEHPVAVRMYEQSMDKLQRIANYELMIPGVDFTSGQENTTARMQYLECSDEDAENGYCDPCAYEYI